MPAAGASVPARHRASAVQFGLVAGGAASTAIAEGMPWVVLVLSWVLHQMPRPRDRCLFALLSIVLPALGGARSRHSSAHRGSSWSARPSPRTWSAKTLAALRRGQEGCQALAPAGGDGRYQHDSGLWAAGTAITRTLGRTPCERYPGPVLSRERGFRRPVWADWSAWRYGGEPGGSFSRQCCGAGRGFPRARQRGTLLAGCR